MLTRSTLYGSSSSSFQEGISIGDSEGRALSKCTGLTRTVGSGYIPPGIILSSHVVKTPYAIQATGRLNLIDGLHVSPNGGGGQYDDASWGIEPTSSCAGYDRYVEIVGGDTFCIRCCKWPAGTDLKGKDYDHSSPCFAGNDIAGCAKVVPGEYGPGFSYREASSLPTFATNSGSRSASSSKRLSNLKAEVEAAGNSTENFAVSVNIVQAHMADADVKKETSAGKERLEMSWLCHVAAVLGMALVL
ncbi:hypothetical protein HDU97_006300 [Phlyctochytrium planicorne]|nr:hypothetical protein HDU97_006300 [Phlyctochytrium planicorne]